MGILNSIALGKSRKSAGNVTFAVRLGVPTFRQKPQRSENYKPTVAQQMQNKVFKFFKANMDNSALKSLLDVTFDQKAQSGKSQTRMNLFYKSFMPHIIAQKAAIFELDNDELYNMGIFLGKNDSQVDKINQGVLGELVLASNNSGNFTMDAAVLDELIAKANANLSENDTPFTINNIFLSFVAATASGKAIIVRPSLVAPSLDSGVYTFNVSSLVSGASASTNAFVILTIANVSADSALDSAGRKFSTDSAYYKPEGEL